jgi:hypothetical protein
LGKIFGAFERGISPSFYSLPPLLLKERGNKGVRLINITNSSRISS